jgi:hypothetical protein
MKYRALGKLSTLEKGPIVRKEGNLKNGGYREKAPTRSNYGQKRRKFEKWWLQQKGTNWKQL